MTLDDGLRAAVAAEMRPIATEVRRLVGELAELRRALPPALGSLSEAAKHLGVSLSTVQRRMKDGRIPYRKIGRRVVVDLGALRPLGDDAVATAARDARGQR